MTLKVEYKSNLFVQLYLLRRVQIMNLGWKQLHGHLYRLQYYLKAKNYFINMTHILVQADGFILREMMLMQMLVVR